MDVDLSDELQPPQAGDITGPPSNPPAVAIRGLSHRYPKATVDAVTALNLAVQPGEAFALLGPNGGGKTTTFRILATLLQASDPDSAVSIFGHDVRSAPAAARRELGVVFQSPSLDVKLTARENLAVQARMYGLSRRESLPRIEAGLDRFRLADRQHEPVEGFSGGMRRKLEIAKALLHRPRLLLMDEPATGLDPAARRELWDHLLKLRETTGLTIAWTTHLMDEAERADRLAVLAAGRLLTISTPADLRGGKDRHAITLRPHDAADLPTLRDHVAAEFGPWPTGREPVVVDQEISFEHAQGPLIVVRLAERFPGQLQRIAVGEPTLEDAYLRLTASADPHLQPADAVR